MLSLAALLAGLFLGLRDLFPLLAAKRSGVIVRKGARAVRVERGADPEGFARLLANRSKGTTVGFGIAMLGLIGVGLNVLALVGFAGPLALVLLLLYLGFAAFAGYCLFRGFATGNMFAFYSLTLFGDATRKGNPVWFWVYAALNLLIVLGGLLTVLGLLAG